MSDDNTETDSSTDADVARDEDAALDGDPFDDLGDVEAEDIDDPFEEVDIEEIDEDDVWEEITGETDDTDVETVGEAEISTGESALAAEAAADENEAIVRKSSYCQKCEFFADPPEVACTNEGTEIVELVDSDRFRVRNCPVVKQRRGTAEDVLEE
ncbi:hypothetical protein HWV23_00230 [Natronomonas halophila]|uniref:hypothetical protein n=1 Tax=Natronomonas halophila TaxID=2747817 RepID=UPI0015B5E85F|nr:hypothetical protein [Natronomonas halophila]QLD84194.1 hypothetical protein HWV23_00230 [Natronomonas halophila]